MKILYDYQIFIKQKYGGISRYFYEIISNIKLSKNLDIDIPVIGSINYYFKKIIICSDMKTRMFLKLINKINTIKLLLTKKYDIIHPTYYESYFLAFKKKAKIVVTIHDMIHEIYPKEFKYSLILIYLKKFLIINSDKIIAVSQNTKNDILKLYPNISANKIKVIYHANSLKSNYKCPQIELPDKYILFVGNRDGYKNFELSAMAIIEVMKKEKDIFFVCVGGGRFSDKETALFENSFIKNRILRLDVNDNQLYSIYKYAICFIFPSLYEGFGIPILEAYFSGCPVLLSNASCFKEIAGDAAIYFNPHDKKDIEKKITLLLYNQKLRQELIIKGYDRNAKFSWDKAAKETLKLYKQVIRG